MLGIMVRVDVVKSLTSDMNWLDNVFISGSNHHLIRWFCEVVLGPTTISKMVLEPLQDLLGHLLSGFCYRATHHLCSRTKPIVLVVRGCVKSRTSDKSWPDNVFISGGNPHLISRFCEVVLGPTTIVSMHSQGSNSKMMFNEKLILNKWEN